MRNPEEGLTEFLTFEQFTQEIKNPSPRCISKPVPSTERFRQRVRISFDFDVMVNDEPILNSGNDEEIMRYDVALLKSFLATDKEKLLHMMMDAIGTEIGLNSTESFMAEFLPEINTNSHVLFEKAIDALRGYDWAYWQETRDEEDLPWGSVLSLATEKLFECFEAEFMSSSYAIVVEQEHDN